VVTGFLSDLQSCIPTLLGSDLHLSAVAAYKQLGLASATRTLVENSESIGQLQLPNDNRKERRVLPEKPKTFTLCQTKNVPAKAVCLLPGDDADIKVARVEQQRLLAAHIGSLSTSTTPAKSVTSPSTGSCSAMIKYPSNVVPVPVAANDTRKNTPVQSLKGNYRKVRTMTVERFMVYIKRRV
jgi:hypothetical protein